MKKIIIGSGFLLLFVLITFSLVNARGTVRGKNKNLQKIIIPLIKQGYDIDENNSLKGVLDRGTSINYVIPLYHGVDYVIVAAGDETTQNIDIKVIDEDKKVIAVDRSSSATAVIKLSPKWTGQFLVAVAMKKCTDQDAHYTTLYAPKD